MQLTCTAYVEIEVELTIDIETDTEPQIVNIKLEGFLGGVRINPRIIGSPAEGYITCTTQMENLLLDYCREPIAQATSRYEEECNRADDRNDLERDES